LNEAKISENDLDEDKRNDYASLDLENDNFAGDANEIRCTVIAEINAIATPNLEEAKEAAKKRLKELIRKNLFADNSEVDDAARDE
jgi:hypothetical protein